MPLETNERIARLETNLSWIKQEMIGQNSIIGKTADDVTEIKIMLSEERGKRSMLKYVGHVATIVIGGLMGFIGGYARHQ